MGQTKKAKKKYSTPPHPWQKDRIIEEKEIVREYGLKNKKELWKFQSKLRNVTKQVKKIVAAKNPKQATLEKENLRAKLLKYGLIKKDTKLAEVLELKTKDFLERRLQTIVFKKGHANSIKQARQLITHGHIKIKDKKVTIPSYLVLLEEESKISLDPSIIILKKENKKDDKLKSEIIKKKEETKQEKVEVPKEEPKVEKKEELKEEKKEGLKIEKKDVK